jgi:3-hydroxyacyl-[acyl-carrier-protein] dehydratase
MLNLEEIKKILPHRYPLLLIDRVLELDPGRYCKALKNVTANEQVFQGHFPRMAVMPGVMLVEAMAQVGGVVIHSVTPAEIVEQSLVFFAGIEKSRFRYPVVPGDQVYLTATVKNNRQSLWILDGKAHVDNKLVAQAEIKLMLQPIFAEKEESAAHV